MKAVVMKQRPEKAPDQTVEWTTGASFLEKSGRAAR